MRIVNIIDKCDDGKKRFRQIDDIRIIAVHRIWFNDVDLDAELLPSTICRRFISDPKVSKYTGGNVPYTFLVDRHGAIYQCLQLREVAPHARRWSVPALGVGVIGDFRSRPPSSAQRVALVDLCAALCPAFDIDPLGDSGFDDTVEAGPGQWIRGEKTARSLSGHSELPGGSADADKQCPGSYLQMDDLRSDVNDMICRNAMAELVSSGASTTPQA